MFQKAYFDVSECKFNREITQQLETVLDQCWSRSIDENLDDFKTVYYLIYNSFLLQLHSDYKLDIIK